MSRVRVGMIAGFVGVLALLETAGCAAPVTTSPPLAQPSGRHLPARPETLAVNGVNPCDLLSASQRTDLNLSDGSTDNESLSNWDLQGSMCLWSSLADSRIGWTGGVILNRSAADTSSVEPLRVVDGFAAVPSALTAADPNGYCQLFVDVAPGQSLSTAFDGESKDNPGMSHQVACDKAQQLAGDMISTLRAQQGK